jgi:hypothetical protein
MGFEQRESGKFFSIVGGKFVERVRDNTVGAVSRTNKNGVIVWELVHDCFVAKLIDIKVVESQNVQIGTQWAFKFQDGEEVYTLNLGYSNHIALAILKMLPNVDLTKPIKMSPSMSKGEDGIDKTSIFLAQDGKNIPYAHKKEAPNGMPEKQIVTVNGKQTSDYTAQIKFLHDMVTTKIVPKLGGVATVAQAPVASGVVADEDIPF